jgi:hypothetical protein
MGAGSSMSLDPLIAAFALHADIGHLALLA